MTGSEWEYEFNGEIYTIIGRIEGDNMNLGFATNEEISHCQVVQYNDKQWNVVDRTRIPPKTSVIPALNSHNYGASEVSGEPKVNHEYFEYNA